MLTFWKVTRAAFEGAGEGVKKLLVQIRGDGDEGDDVASQGVDRAVFFSQLGVAVRPVVARTLRAIGVEHGDEVALLKLWDSARSPTDLDEGETRVFSAGTIATSLRMLADRIDVNATRINLGGAATKKVSRVGDAVRVTIPSGTTLTGTVGMTPTTFTTTAPVECNGTITEGSNKVRAED